MNSLDRRRLIDASKAEKKKQLAPFFYSLALLPELLRASARGAALVQRVAGDTWSSGVEVVCVAVGRREREVSQKGESGGGSSSGDGNRPRERAAAASDAESFLCPALCSQLFLPFVASQMSERRDLSSAGRSQRAENGKQGGRASSRRLERKSSREREGMMRSHSIDSCSTFPRRRGYEEPRRPALCSWQSA